MVILRHGELLSQAYLSRWLSAAVIFIAVNFHHGDFLSRWISVTGPIPLILDGTRRHLMITYDFSWDVLTLAISTSHFLRVLDICRITDQFYAVF